MSSNIPNLNSAIPGQTIPTVPMNIPPPTFGANPNAGFQGQAIPDLQSGIPQITPQVPPSISTFAAGEGNNSSSQQLPNLTIPSFDSEPKKQGLTSSQEFDFNTLPKHKSPDFSSKIQYDSAKYPNVNSAVQSLQVNQELIIPADSKFVDSIVVKSSCVKISGSNSEIKSNGRDAAIIINSPTIVELSGITFIQETSQAIGALLVERGDVLIENCTFNSAIMPAVIAKGNSRLYFVNCTFVSRESIALLLAQTVCCTLTNCQIINSNQGIILKQKSLCHVSGTQFSSITSNVIAALNESQLLVEDSSFQASSSTSLNIKTTKPVTVRRTTFSDLQQAVAVSESSSLSVSQAKFSNVTQGALLIRGSCRTDRCEFSDCTSGSMIIAIGRAALQSNNDRFSSSANDAFIASVGSAKVEVANATFDSCRCQSCVVCYNEAFARVRASKFVATQGIGAQCYERGSLIVADSTFDRPQESAVVILGTSKSNISNIAIDGAEKNGIVLQNVAGGLVVERCSIKSCRECGILALNSNFVLAQTSLASNRVALDARNVCADGNAQNALQIGTVKFLANEQGAVFTDSNNVVLDNCEFTQSATASLVATNTRLKIAKSQFGSSKIALVVCGGSNVTAQTLAINTSEDKAVVVTNPNTFCSIEDSTFTDNRYCVSVSDSASLQLSRSRITGGELQLDCDRGTAKCTQVEFVRCAGQAAVHNHDQSTLTLEKCCVREGKQVGIISSANMLFTQGQILNNGVLGCYFHENASGKVQESVIQSNGNCGVHFVAGNTALLYTRIANHTGYGVRVDSDAQPEIRNNDVSNNAINIERE